MALRATLLVMLVLGGCASSGGVETPCTPPCAPGQTCTFGVCVVACNPPCGASQQCVIVQGATQCVGIDAGVLRDAGGDRQDQEGPFPDGDDAALSLDAWVDGAPEVPSEDGRVEGGTEVGVDTTGGTVEVSVGDVFDGSAPMDMPGDAPTEFAGLDVPRDAFSEAPMMDVGLDTAPEGPTMDVPRDTLSEPATMDASTEGPPSDAYVPPVCGEAGQPCCGGRGSDVACRAGLLCNAFENGRCVPVTSPEPLECNATASCTGGRVCQGASFCGTRACMRCAFAGMLGFDAVCDPRMGGTTCATGVCLTGRCSWACAPGTAGDAECSRRAPNTRCQEAYYGVVNERDPMRPMAWVTLGSCALVCRRNADCPMGRVCAAVPSLLDDRVEYYCVNDGRMPSGATCTASEMCQSFLCLSIPGVGRRCTTPCVSDADCPAGQRCGDVALLRPGSGAEQPSRGCLPR
jgi:hypothetical protein